MKIKKSIIAASLAALFALSLLHAPVVLAYAIPGIEEMPETESIELDEVSMEESAFQAIQLQAIQAVIDTYKAHDANIPTNSTFLNMGGLVWLRALEFLWEGDEYGFYEALIYADSWFQAHGIRTFNTWTLNFDVVGTPGGIAEAVYETVMRSQNRFDSGYELFYHSYFGIAVIPDSPGFLEDLTRYMYFDFTDVLTYWIVFVWSDYYGTPNLWSQFMYTQSSILLQDKRLTAAERAEWVDEYHAMGGPSAFELEVVRLVNAKRVAYGLNELQIDTNLMMAARFYTQIMANLNTELGHHYGPYGGSWGVAASFGGRGGWGVNGHWGLMTPEITVQGWMDSPGHRRNILNPTFRYIGAGSHIGGRWDVFHYNIFSDSPSAR